MSEKLRPSVLLGMRALLAAVMLTAVPATDLALGTGHRRAGGAGGNGAHSIPGTGGGVC